VEITSEEYEGKYSDRKTAKQWMRENLRGEYTNNDTSERIIVSNAGINEVTSHGTTDEAHMKSLVAIPRMIESSIFIDELDNSKGNGKADSYRYYVCPLKIDGEDYTAKIVVGKKNGSSYYDHRLTQIEKGKLISSLNRLSNSVAENEASPISEDKDSDISSTVQEKLKKVLKINLRCLDAPFLWCC